MLADRHRRRRRTDHGRERAERLAHGSRPGSQHAEEPSHPERHTAAEGPAGFAGIQLVSEITANDTTNEKLVDVTCPAGKRIIAGGATVYSASNDVALTESSVDNLIAWQARGVETDYTDEKWSLRVWGVCVQV